MIPRNHWSNNFVNVIIIKSLDVTKFFLTFFSTSLWNLHSIPKNKERLVMCKMNIFAIFLFFLLLSKKHFNFILSLLNKIWEIYMNILPTRMWKFSLFFSYLFAHSLCSFDCERRNIYKLLFVPWIFIYYLWRLFSLFFVVCFYCELKTMNSMKNSTHIHV